MVECARGRATWPLSFQMSPDGRGFWSHDLYRGPQGQPVRVFYTRAKLQSDEIAHEFLHEKVIGFDMEWPSGANTTATIPLQQRIGLIQIACEDKIALFHIGMHSGTTAKDLLAPALRRIIEDPAIAKCGVAVHNADFARLQRWFGLRPRGAFELSHLHNLVSFGASKPASCTTKLRGLAAQVEQHLGLPLHKGSVRTSNWSQPLNNDQLHYAAADAYAGFMLFHCLNAKRIVMDPSPPLPVYAETYGRAAPGKPPERLLQLLPQPGAVQPTSVLSFYQPPGGAGSEPAQHKQAAYDKKASPPTEGGRRCVRIGPRGRHILFAEAADAGADVVQQLRVQHAAEQHRPQGGVSPGGISPSMTPATNSAPLEAKASGAVEKRGVLDKARTELLFQELSKHRRHLAKQRRCAPFVIARDTLLHTISRKCPRSHAEMLTVYGIGEKKLADFGPAWLAIVKGFVEKAAIDDAARADEDGQQPSSDIRTTLLPGLSAPQALHDQPIKSMPTLHTGISFNMQNASLDCEEDNEDVSDNSSAFGTPLKGASPSILKRKRQEIESPQKPDQGRVGQPRRKYHAGRGPRAVASEASGASHDLAATTNLHQSDQRNTNVGPVMMQTPRIDCDDALAPREISGISRTAAGRISSAAPSKAVATQRPSVESEVKSQPAAGLSSDREVQAKILRNKIAAFNKLVTASVRLPSDTVEHLVHKLPTTMGELLQVPGILPFANACSRANRDLLGFLAKCAPATG